ncbi:MAG: tellurium resistance protein TerC [Myxococcales bacterium]|nr:tellurium resistance protein TerC [Myxococcales bacterium]
MPELLADLMTLAMLVMLQAVLGFDNLLYISLESKKAPQEDRSQVRKWGIGIAIALRIILLFVLVNLIELLKDPLFSIQLSWFEANLTLHSIIVLIGGVFIIYTAIKEITHMIAVEDFEAEHQGDTKLSSTKSIVGKIVIMNLVFSFDSILSAMALTSSLAIMSIAIIISGIMMIWLADQVSTFLQKNRLYEVLGLFILLIVGVMLLTEGGHLGELSFFGHHIVPMSKATFYFVIITLVLIDIVQARYQKKLLKERKSL